jgi:hypothetical protein
VGEEGVAKGQEAAPPLSTDCSRIENCDAVVPREILRIERQNLLCSVHRHGRNESRVVAAFAGDAVSLDQTFPFELEREFGKQDKERFESGHFVDGFLNG